MLQRLSQGLRTTCVVALMTVATYAAAQTMRGDHPDTYVVERGDTLWDIAGRFLQRPWLWPEIWQANPQIANPHLIYPGDVISLAYLNRVTAEPGPREEAPINAIPLSEVEPFLKDLRVVDAFEHLPYVVGLEEDRLRATQGQVAYIRGLPSAAPGQRYAVVRPTVRYTHVSRDSLCCDLFHTDDLDFRGRRTIDFQQYWTNVLTPDKGQELLGYELQRVNVGTITRGEVGGIQASTLLLDETGREVRVGDRLIPVDAQPYDLQFFPHAPAHQLDYGRARVLAVADALAHGGPRDVIVLSVGAREGVDNGTVFSLWREGTNTIDRVEKGADRDPDTVFHENKVRLPDEFAGHAMVFRTYDKVSYALVMDSIKPTRVGYHLKHPDAPY
ncbi:LysM peptidoglycan-binding domain-containing protein [Luteimonas wenzhouensis]|uniref:LysM peptidoglycan-binding domain-containing protein n=1 Tax=Luteimonas wenzhouensis TaxID=2599615 RepID=A0A5C5TZ16_9GAMM|nr:LysM peptidoglycan-binding domain-containing protein [Luteimonas wenzhouensis]TWT19006.1 LysM peptidoglycan-binding domain-containing protein [Luteimonas wenzhouensis]